MTNLVLYHADLSPCAHKVRFALEEREIPFEGRCLDLMAKENLAPDYLKLNPKGVVPTLVNGDDIVTESTVICEYLEDCFHDNSLLPETAIGRAKVRYWLKLVDEQLHPNTMPVVFGGLARHIWLAKPAEERERLLAQVPDPNRRARQSRLIELGLDAPDLDPALNVWLQTFVKMNQQLSETKWLAGDSFTLADCALAPYIFIMDYLNVRAAFESHPHVASWMNSLKSRRSFDASVAPYVSEQRWASITTVAQKTGPILGDKILQKMQ